MSAPDAEGEVRRLAAEAAGDLATFAAIPSVSALAAHRGDVLKAAAWLAGRLSRAGLSGVELLPTAGNPVVTAEAGPADAPTVLVYGHYDVQPADPLEAWESPPFTPTVKDGRLVARGSSDDKGPILCALAGIEARLRLAPPTDVRLKFLFEGEEEIGSPSLPAFLGRERERFRADLVLSADGGM